MTVLRLPFPRLTLLFILTSVMSGRCRTRGLTFPRPSLLNWRWPRFVRSNLRLCLYWTALVLVSFKLKKWRRRRIIVKCHPVNLTKNLKGQKLLIKSRGLKPLNVSVLKLFRVIVKFVTVSRPSLPLTWRGRVTVKFRLPLSLMTLLPLIMVIFLMNGLVLFRLFLV